MNNLPAMSWLGYRRHHTHNVLLIAYYEHGVICLVQRDIPVFLNRPIEWSLCRNGLYSIEERILGFSTTKKDLLRYCAHLHKAEPDLNLRIVLAAVPTSTVYPCSSSRGSGNIEGCFVSTVIPIKYKEIDVKRSIYYKREVKTLL